MSTTTLEEKIAEIIEGLDDDSDVVEAIKNGLDFGDVVSDDLEKDGPIKRAAINLMVTVLGKIKDQDTGEFEETITEAADMEKIAKKLLRENDEVKKALEEAVKDALKSNIENHDFSDDDLVQYFDLKKTVEKLAENEELQGFVRERVTNFIRDYDLTGDEEETIVGVVFDEENVKRVVQGRDDVDEVARDKVKSVLESGDGVEEQVLESQAFKTLLERAIDRSVSDRQLDNLVGKVVEKMVTDGNPALQSRISEAVADKLVGKLAEKLVERMLAR